MKKLLLLLAIGLMPFAIGIGEGVEIGKVTATVTDSLHAVDTVGNAVRLDSDTTVKVDMRKYDKFSFVIASTHDTNFVDDSTIVILQYSIDKDDENLWVGLDTLAIGIHLVDDTTYSTGWYSIDSLPPLNYVRFICSHRDKIEVSANNVGIYTNTYDYDFTIWMKAIK